MSDEAMLYQFFSVLREKHKAFSDNYAFFAPKLAPRFNSFKFIRPDEMKLSEILAMLLNPEGDHEQGDIFLQLLFAEIDLTYPNNTRNIKVGCEVSTDRIENRSRRIDIEINFGDHFGVAIENKPWAYDQFQQLIDYAKQMDAKFEKWCLIYLSGDDSDPNDDSASPAQLETWEENNQYKKINFGQIVEWLKKCEAQCQSDHLRHFLRDFIGYCKSEFLGETDMVDANLIKDFALKSENLELALAIGQQMAVIKNELFDKFLKDLKTEFETIYQGWQFIYEDFPKPITIKFRKPEWNNYAIAIEFGSNYSYCDLGIRKKDRAICDLSFDMLQNLDKQLTRRWSTNSYWPRWYRLPSPYSNWQTNVEPWLNIPSGETAKIILEKIVELALVSSAIIDEAELAICLGTQIAKVQLRETGS
jgi:hypothetical protein